MKKRFVWGGAVAGCLAVALVNGPIASGSETKDVGGSPNASVESASLALQSREITEAAVTSLREGLGLSDAEARQRFAAQPRLDALGRKLLRQLGDRQAGA